jgi:hypothetical protein
MFDNSISPGRLSVPPKTVFDFTSAALDPRVTFSRTGTTATLINSSGLVGATAADAPRFDFDFATGRCRGLLVEEARTNIYIYSEELNRAITINSTVATDVAGITTPDGAATAEKIEENTTNGQHAIERQFAGAIGDYSMSGFFKAAERTSIRLNLASTTLNAIAVFNLSNGTITTTSGALSATITPLANGWYRCTISATQPDSRTLQARFALIQSGTTHSYAGTTGFGAYAWGAQLERNSSPTSYIKTEATSVVRNADIATITGTNFSNFWQAGKGSALVRARPSTVSGTRPWVQFDDTTADNIIALRGNTTNPELYIKATTDQAQIDAGTIAANTSYRLAGAWATNDCAASVNSGTPVLDGVATIPVVTQARLGSDGTNYLNGHLESVEYYDERVLSASLQVVSSTAGYRSIIGPVFRDTIIS